MIKRLCHTKLRIINIKMCIIRLKNRLLFLIKRNLNIATSNFIEDTCVDIVSTALNPVR